MRKNYTDTAARVAAMSRSMARVQRAVDALKRDLARLNRLDREVAQLDEYQRSGLWQKDFEADEAGEVPSGINRAVLSEDALYNLLREWDDLRNRFSKN